MPLHLTNVTLIGLTLLSAACSVWAVRQLRGALVTASPLQESPDTTRPARVVHPLLLDAAVLCISLVALLLLVLSWRRGARWNPVGSHLDGLLLLSVLLGGVTVFLHTRPRLSGLAAFTLPLLTFLLAWAICAATWTQRDFIVSELHPVWSSVHLLGVYLGTLGSAIAAVAGGMYLVVENRLKRKRDPRGLMRLASLEALERIIVHTATLGFTLLTVGLVSGVVILQQEPGRLGPGWWYAPKVLLAFAAWLVYALVMNVRYATAFRGRRAAWLAMAGFVLLLVVYGLVTASPSPSHGGLH